VRLKVSGGKGIGHRDKKKDVAGCGLRVASHGLGVSGLGRRCMGRRAKGIGLRVSFLGGGNEENEERGSLNDN
jgi:hypothetical protein